jgi:hypothetical protein
MDNRNQNIWLVYSLVPQDIFVYFIPFHVLTDEDYKVFDLCHYKFANAANDNSPEVEAAFEKLERWLNPSEGEGRFAFWKVDNTSVPPTTEKPTKLIVTGFLL